MKQLLIIFALLISLNVLAQKEKYQITSEDYSNNGVEMADDMRQSGKIFVVVGVVAIIFAGIVFYLVRLDKKITLLEKEALYNQEA